MIRSETQGADPIGKTILTTLSAQNLNLNRNLNLNPAQYRPIFPGRAAAAAPPNSKATDPNRNLSGLSEATKKSKLFSVPATRLPALTLSAAFVVLSQ